MNLVPDSSSDEGAARPPRQKQRRKDPLSPDGEIGSRLRALYAEIEREPIPMELIDLLEKLSEAERRSRS